MEAEQDGGMSAGKIEPYFLHAHVLGRGVPQHEYIAGIPLDAPDIGTEFNLKWEGDAACRLAKIPWNSHQRLIFQKTLREWLKAQAEHAEDWKLISGRA